MTIALARSLWPWMPTAGEAWVRLLGVCLLLSLLFQAFWCLEEPGCLSWIAWPIKLFKLQGRLEARGLAERSGLAELCLAVGLGRSLALRAPFGHRLPAWLKMGFCLFNAWSTASLSVSVIATFWAPLLAERPLVGAAFATVDETLWKVLSAF